MLAEHIFGTRFAMDTWLAADTESDKPGLMSAQTAFGLLLLGAIIPWNRVREGAICAAIDALTLLFAAFVLVQVAGYIFGAAHLFGESTADAGLSPDSPLFRAPRTRGDRAPLGGWRALGARRHRHR